MTVRDVMRTVGSKQQIPAYILWHCCFGTYSFSVPN